PLDEGAGSIVDDKTAGGHDGTLAGGTATPLWSTAHPVSVDIQGGSLMGAGTISADVTNSGQITVGGSGLAGTLAVAGNYTQTSGGALNVEVGGLAAGAQFDQLAIDGAATLAGTLNVGLINSFAPT